MQAYQSRIAENLVEVNREIDRALDRAGRAGEKISLVVVTKGQPYVKIQTAAALGLQNFGENYIEEAREKMNLLRGLPSVSWHFIGHLQSRKVTLLGNQFGLIHSLDRQKFATKLETYLAASGRNQAVLLQVNVSGEPEKSGFPAWLPEHEAQLFESVEKISDCRHVVIHGLMTIPPFHQNPEHARPYFRRLRELRERLKARFPGTDWETLSMGMSLDYRVAIEEGANMIRLGQVILGPRS